MAEAPFEIAVRLAPDVARRLADLAAREGSTVEAYSAKVLHDVLAPAVTTPGLFEPGIADDVIATLDRIPGAWESIERGREDARAGRTTPLDDLL